MTVFPDGRSPAVVAGRRTSRPPGWTDLHHLRQRDHGRHAGIQQLPRPCPPRLEVSPTHARLHLTSRSWPAVTGFGHPRDQRTDQDPGYPEHRPTVVARHAELHLPVRRRRRHAAGARRRARCSELGASNGTQEERDRSAPGRRIMSRPIASSINCSSRAPPGSTVFSQPVVRRADHQR